MPRSIDCTVTCERECAGRYFSASELLSSLNACEWLVIVTVMISCEMRVYEYVAMGGCRGGLGDLDWRE